MQEIGTNFQQSEVARLVAQMEAEYESAQRALYSTAYGTCKHTFITRRMERMGVLHDELEELIGDEAHRVMVGVMEG